MHLVDTNVILRYVLQDHEDFYRQAKILMESEEIFIPVEVVAEAVYVLEKVYHVDRSDIQDMLCTLDEYDNIAFAENEVVVSALSIYCRHRIDFIDAILCGYHQNQSRQLTSLCLWPGG